MSKMSLKSRLRGDAPRPIRVALHAAILVPSAFLLAVAPALAQGSSAREVLETAVERYEERMQGVENYAVIQLTGETLDTLYYEREMVQGHPVYHPDLSIQGLPEEQANRAESAGSMQPYRFFDQIASRARLRGTETVDGREAYVIAVDDMSGIDFGMTGAGGRGFTPRSATLWMDTERYVPRRIVLEGSTEAEEERQAATFDVHLTDYREVEGVLHPFHMEASIQSEQVSRAMEQMQERLEQMPEEQREMVEAMMRERMGAIAEGGAIQFTVQVEEVLVNEGPPEGETR